MTEEQPRLKTEKTDSQTILEPQGEWIIDHANTLEKALRDIRFSEGQNLLIRGAGLSRFDTFGAWQLFRLFRAAQSAGAEIKREKFDPNLVKLLKRMEAQEPKRPKTPERVNPVQRRLSALGKLVLDMCSHHGKLFAFIGMVILRFALALFKPARFRVTSIFTQLEQVGFNALFIIGLISFLIGAVIVNQGQIQLRQFGADVFTIDLLAISHLRELGPILAAIMVAGRSGSAFTAEIGSMKIHEEVDALKTIGLNPVDVLVLPRLLALVFIMPILTFFADIMGMAGGMMMSVIMLDISPEGFLNRFREAIFMKTFYVGLIKAPFFGAVIAINGCYEGLTVGGSAESVGKNTTRSVVQSIFMVIVLDALFAMFFTAVGW